MLCRIVFVNLNCDIRSLSHIINFRGNSFIISLHDFEGFVVVPFTTSDGSPWLIVWVHMQWLNDCGVCEDINSQQWKHFALYKPNLPALVSHLSSWFIFSVSFLCNGPYSF